MMPYFSNVRSAVLLSELGDDLGLQLTFDEHGQCLLVLDENLMISIRQSEDNWILYGMLGEFWPHDSDVFQYLLSLNQSLAEQGQGVLAFDPKNNAVLYLYRISLKDTDRALLYQVLETFTDRLETLIQHLNESAAGRARMQGPVFSPMIAARQQGRRM